MLSDTAGILLATKYSTRDKKERSEAIHAHVHVHTPSNENLPVLCMGLGTLSSFVFRW
jgi:hypothetical protein